jgi:hypothetical protein
VRVQVVRVSFIIPPGTHATLVVSCCDRKLTRALENIHEDFLRRRVGILIAHINALHGRRQALVAEALSYQECAGILTTEQRPERVLENMEVSLAGCDQWI